MIIVLQPQATEHDIDQVQRLLRERGLTPHVSRGVERTVVGVLGPVGPTGVPGALQGITPELGDYLAGLPHVETVLQVSKPYKLASREFHPEATQVRVTAPHGDVIVGGEAVVMMAGPCTVESETQLLAAAHAARAGGASILRGGAYKP
ncbi:MAG TPA: 3-deoxy-7-phosphoheptulonate synthase, partial [Ktedonobacterales bacterium]